MNRELKLPREKSMFQDKSQSFIEYDLTMIIEIGGNMTLNNKTHLIYLIKEIMNIIVGSYHIE